MKVNEMFPSRWLKAGELTRPVVVTIDKVEQAMVRRNGVPERIWVLAVVGAKKQIILSRRLALEIATAVGTDETDQWPGKRFVLCTKQISAFGRSFTVLGAWPLNPNQGGSNGRDSDSGSGGFRPGAHNAQGNQQGPAVLAGQCREAVGNPGGDAANGGGIGPGNRPAA